MSAARLTLEMSAKRLAPRLRRKGDRMSQQNVDVIRSTYEAFGRGDMDAVAAAFAETEWHEAQGMPYGGTFTGTEAIFANVLGPISQDVEGFSARPDEILDAGDEKVVSLGTYSGQGANGPVDIPYAHVWTVRDGKIVHFVQHTDTKLFSEAVGK
jgi:ketosteroid isomerase-like protein